MTLEQIRERLKDLRLARVAHKTGVHYNTLKEIRDNPQANPTARTMQAVIDYLEG